MAKCLYDILPPFANVSAIARAIGMSPQGLHQALAGRFALAHDRQATLARLLKVPRRVVKEAVAETMRRARK